MKPGGNSHFRADDVIPEAIRSKPLSALLLQPSLDLLHIRK